MKKIAWVVLLSFVANTAFAGGLIKAGETFTAKESVRYFTMSEAKQLLDDLDTLKIMKERIKVFEATEKKLDQFSQAMDKVELMRQDAVTQYKESVQMFRGSAEHAQKAATMYEGVIKSQQTYLEYMTKQAQQRERTSRWQRNLYGFLGFIAPIAGAWAVGQVKNGIKF